MLITFYLRDSIFFNDVSHVLMISVVFSVASKCMDIYIYI